MRFWPEIHRVSNDGKSPAKVVRKSMVGITPDCLVILSRERILQLYKKAI
jgi:hypothetical protein